VLAAPAALEPLVRLSGAVDRLLPTGELEPIRWIGAPPEVAVDLHGNGPASHQLVAATGAGTLMMYASRAAPDVTGPWWDPDEHEAARWCRLLEWWGLPADGTALRLAPPVVPAPITGAVVVHPGAASGSRRWPPDRFAAVARALAAEGRPVVITGTGAERTLACEVASQAGLPPVSVLAGRTGLTDLAALVSQASVVISNDTGVAHLAFAYARPSVTLYGPVSPGLWGPPPNAGRHLALWHGTGGRPGDPHAAVTDARLLRITAAEVLSAARTAAASDHPT
jgi:ADP-heptose:LPS heptosyltransferase